MNWQQFDYQDFQEGLFWLVAETPDYDIDADDCGRAAGTPTGETVRAVVLAEVSRDHDGYPYFDRVGFEQGRLGEDSVITHYAELTAPALPEGAR